MWLNTESDWGSQISLCDIYSEFDFISGTGNQKSEYYSFHVDMIKIIIQGILYATKTVSDSSEPY